MNIPLIKEKIQNAIESYKDKTGSYGSSIEFYIQNSINNGVESIKHRITIWIYCTGKPSFNVNSETHDDIYKCYIDVKNRLEMELQLRDKLTNYKQELRKDQIEYLEEAE